MPHLIALDPANLREPSIPASPPPRWVVGAYVSGELTGFVSTFGGLSDDCVETTLFVHVKWRRQGIGSLLLAAAVEWALPRQARALRLVCGRADWPMRHFAEKTGARLDLAFGQIVADIPLSKGSGDRHLSLPSPWKHRRRMTMSLGASEANPEPQS